MASAQLDIKLSIEETALAMTMAGYPDAAKGLLFTTFGEIPVAEEQGRMLAAGHSLMARGLVAIHDGQARIQESFRPLIEALTTPDFVVQYSLTTSSAEQTLGYFFKGGNIARQSVEEGVVYRLTTGEGTEQVITGGLTFFSISEKHSVSHPQAMLSVAILDRASKESHESAGALFDLLSGAGIPNQLARPLAEDFQKATSRGAVLLIKRQGSDLRSDHGFLLMQSQDRTWLFPLVEKAGEAHAKVIIASQESFAAEMQKLIGKMGR